MEAFGLALVVVLLALGMFFLIKFSSTQQAAPQIISFQQKQVITDFINTLLHSEAGCTGSTATFSDLLDNLEDPFFSSLQCGGYANEGLRTYFEEKIKEILNKTVDKWNYAYEFGVIFPAESPAAGTGQIVINHNCNTQQADAVRYTIPADYGDIYVVMKICY